MPTIVRLGNAEPLSGAEWVVIEHAWSGGFHASGLSAVEDAVYGGEALGLVVQRVADRSRRLLHVFRRSLESELWLGRERFGCLDLSRQDRREVACRTAVAPFSEKLRVRTDRTR